MRIFFSQQRPSLILFPSYPSVEKTLDGLLARDELTVPARAIADDLRYLMRVAIPVVPIVFILNLLIINILHVLHCVVGAGLWDFIEV